MGCDGYDAPPFYAWPCALVGFLVLAFLIYHTPGFLVAVSRGFKAVARNPCSVYPALHTIFGGLLFGVFILGAGGLLVWPLGWLATTFLN